MTKHSTKQALAQSLKQKLKEKPLDKITIKDICEGCHVNRQTFYYHFTDIYDLIAWIYTNAETVILKDNMQSLSWEEGLSRLFAYAILEKDFVLATYHSVSREHLERFLYQEAYRYLYELISIHLKGRSCSEEDKQLLTNFYKYAFVGFVLDWVQKGMKEEPKKIIQKLKRLAAAGHMPIFDERL